MFDRLPMLSRSILTVAVSLVLAACGGGGSGGGGTPVSRTTPDTQATTDLVIPTIPSSAPPIANIARARPRPGSVTQSSNVGADGITLDQITFDRTNFTISNRNGFSFSNPVDGDDPNFSTIYDAKNYYYVVDYSRVFDVDDTPLTKEFYNRFNQYNFNNLLSGLKGRESVSAFYRETDYLVLGYWLKTDQTLDNQGVTISSSFSDIGSFVTGGDLFNDNNIPIEGNANYQGIGYVVSFEGNDVSFSQGVFRNDVSGAVGESSLSVDFSSGIIRGTLSNFLGIDIKANTDTWKNYEEPQKLSGELILNNAKIGNSHSGFFEGNLTGTFNGKSYNGLYGGQFYGNNESDGKPGTVAGTLGGISSDGRFTLTGFWMGDK